MRTKFRLIMAVVSIVSALCIVITSFYFIRNVQTQLWKKTVTDILEVTTQGRHALDTYIEKDYDTLSLFVNEISRLKSNDTDHIKKIIELFDEDVTSFYCSNLMNSNTYSDQSDGVYTLSEEQRLQYLSMSDSGIQEPYYDSFTGVKTISVYERFTFADGAQAIALKARTVQTVVDSFALSFFDNTGFSYIVNDRGDVLIRSLHRNSNRTFQNLFDIIDLEGNDEEKINIFQSKLKNRSSGSVQFHYQDKEYIYCYVPMESVDGWYLISIIPSDIVMSQANTIIYNAIGLCVLIMLCLAMVGYVFYRSNKKHHQEVEDLAFYDNLTKLYRYEKFLMEGDRILRSSKDAFVLYIDIIGFKLLNDMEGYDYGDRVLKFMADMLRQVSQPEDITCRISGDDFILMGCCESKDEILELASRIQDLAAKGLDENRSINTRIGICMQKDTGQTSGIEISSMIDWARMAQKSVDERSEKNCRFYNHQLRSTLIKDAELEKDMNRALQKGEFLYLIQPKFTLDGKHIVGGEALVRWLRNGVFVGPGEFIPLFERNGFIRRLDEYVFEKVCQDIQDRIQRQLPIVPISVNVSRAHLYWDNFADTYIAIKEKYQIPEGILELELTENILIRNVQEVLPIMKKLADNGFSCSIDDFGSGYSSLNTLKDLPVDVVKMDKVFFDQNDHMERNQIVLRNMIMMAKQLSMKVVAEGIENEAQLAMIKDTECDMVQGFLYARPIDKQEFYKELDPNEQDQK